MRGKEKPGKTNCGKIVEVRVNLGETGMGRVLSLRIPVLFNLRCLMKLTQKTKNKKQKKQNNNKKIYICIYLTRYSPISRQAGINFLPSLVPCTGSEKSVSPNISTSLQI